MNPNPAASFITTFRKVMMWLFFLSIVGIPVSWFFLSSTVLLYAIGFFALMFFYQLLETFYDEHKQRRLMRELDQENQKAKEILASMEKPASIHHHKLRKGMITTTDFLKASPDGKMALAIDGIAHLNANADYLILQLNKHEAWMKVIASMPLDPEASAKLERAANNFRYKMEKLLRQIDANVKQVNATTQQVTPIQNI